MRRGLGFLAGVVLLAVAVGFCVDTFLDERARVDDALASASPAWLLVAVLLAGAAMATVAVGWRRCLAVVGTEQAPGDVVRWYFVGELGKYVPGGIWPIVGRGELARRAGVPRGAAYQSVALSLAAWYGAALFPVAVAAAHPRAQRAAAAAARRASRGRIEPSVLPWRTVVGLVAAYVPAWVLIAASSVAVTAAFGESPGWQVPAAAVVAWVAGFVAVPVPAGAGVREAVFIATSGLDGGTALTVAVTARLAFVAVDLAGAAASASRMSASVLSRVPGR